MKTKIYFLSALMQLATLSNVALCQNKISDNLKTEQVYVIVEQMPTFKGKNIKEVQQYLQEHIVYPYSAYKQKKEGKVIVQFTVNKFGYIKNPEIKGECSAFNYETLKTLFSTNGKWEAGKLHNIPVDVRITLLFDFTISKNANVGKKDDNFNYYKQIQIIMQSEQITNKKTDEILNSINTKVKTKGWYYYNNLTDDAKQKVAKISFSKTTESVFLYFKKDTLENTHKKSKGNINEDVRKLLQINDSVMAVGFKLTSNNKVSFATTKIKIGDEAILKYKQISDKKEIDMLMW